MSIESCSKWSVALAAALVLTACGSEAPAPSAAQDAKTAIASVPADALRTRASDAMAARRYFAPAGESAAELLLELRERGLATAGDTAALSELQPYLVIAVEQAVERGEPIEAQRLVDLLARIDAAAPALQRLRTAVDGVREAAAAARVAQAQADAKAAEAATAQARAVDAEARASLVAAPRPQATPSTTIATPAAPVAATTPPAQRVATDAAPVTAQPRPAAPEPASEEPAMRAAPALRLVQDAAPRYPARALDRRIDGRVELMFTVQPDGSVADVRVVDAQPAGLFDQAAVQAARRWRFAPIASAATTSRALRFTPPPR